VSYRCQSAGCQNPVPAPDTICDECHLGAQRVKVDPNLQARLESRLPCPTIQYNMSPQRFMLEIPVEALANMDPISEQRLHDMLGYWITLNRPPRIPKG